MDNEKLNEILEKLKDIDYNTDNLSNILKELKKLNAKIESLDTHVQEILDNISN